MIITKNLYKLKRKKGTSPIIATILLIGLTVISGAVVYSVTTGFLQTKQPLALDYTTPTVFKSTETNYKTVDSNIDTFDMQITNPLYEQILVDLSQTYLFNSTDNTMLSNWYVKSNASTLILFGKESATITFATQSALNSAELVNGDKVYVKFKIDRFSSTDSKIITTDNFTVSLSNFNPNFAFTPSSTSVQDLNTVYFMANDNEEITTSIQGVLWNYGNSDKSYQKTLTLTLGNESVFHIDPQYATQTVTIPSSSIVGDQNNLGVCDAGEACVNVSFPITKFNLTEKNIVSNTDTYGAILSISGMNLVTFELKTATPLVKITLESSYHGHSKDHEHEHDHKNKIIYNTITFDGDNKKTDSVTTTFDIWNLDTNPRTANIEIIGLNTTAFSLTTHIEDKKYDYNPQSVSLSAGSTSKNNKNTYTCYNENKQDCSTVTWQITRNKLIDHGEPTGIDAGTYNVTIRDTITGVQLNVDLIIPQFVSRLHVQSMHVEKQTNGNEHSKNDKKTDITFTVEILDQNDDPVQSVIVTAQWTTPNGHKTTVYATTDKDGIATFSYKNVASGTHKLTIIDLSVKSDHKSSSYYIYDSGANKIDPATLSIKV